MKLISLLFPKSAGRRRAGLLLVFSTLLLCLPSDHNIFVQAQEYYDDYAQQQEQDDYGAPPQQPADNLYHDYAARHEAGK